MPMNKLPTFDTESPNDDPSPFELRVKPVELKIDDNHVVAFDPIEVEFAIQDIQDRLGPEQGVKPTFIVGDLLLWMKKKLGYAESNHSLTFSDAYSLYRIARRTYEVAEKKLDAVLKSLDSSTAESMQSEQANARSESYTPKSPDSQESTNTESDKATAN